MYYPSWNLSVNHTRLHLYSGRSKKYCVVRIVFFKQWISVFFFTIQSVLFVTFFQCCIVRSIFKHACHCLFRFLINRNIINDCYFTTIPLLYPPHLIAATTIYMMCIYNSIDPQKVFEQMGIEMSMVKAICAHICGFYDSGEELWPGSISDTILSLSSQFHRE